MEQWSDVVETMYSWYEVAFLNERRQMLDALSTELCISTITHRLELTTSHNNVGIFTIPVQNRLTD